MKFKQGQIIQTPSIPLLGWYLRWIPWVITVFAGVGYLSGVLTTQPRTLLSLLLLTGTYGAWLVIYHLGQRRFEGRPHPFWLLALFCLSSYVAIRRIVPDWDVSSQVSLPLAFLSIYGYALLIYELAVAHTALSGSNAKLAAVQLEMATQLEARVDVVLPLTLQGQAEGSATGAHATREKV